jgi:hypothetical protein
LLKGRRSLSPHASMAPGATVVPGPRRLRNGLRLMFAVASVAMLAVFLAVFGLYLLLRGEAMENSALNAQIESTIERLIGEGYDIDLGRTEIAFDPDGLLSVQGTDVRILRAGSGELVSRLGRVAVGVRPWSILMGSPEVDAVIIENSIVDLGVLPLPVSGAPVRDLKSAMRTLASRFERLNGEFEGRRFRLFRFANVTISGAGLGRREPDDIRLEQLEVRLRRGSNLSLSAELSTRHSSLRLRGSYRPEAEGGRKLEIGLLGLNLREWLRDPRGDDGFLASDATLSLDASMTVAADGTPADPQFTLTAPRSRLRMGFRDRTTIAPLELKFSLLLDKDQIELEESFFEAGGASARIYGGIVPEDPQAGYSGPLTFELIANPVTGSPTREGEAPAMAGLDALGRIDLAGRVVSLERVRVRNEQGDDLMSGSVNFSFEGPTPAIRADVTGGGLDIALVKQMWPFFIASPARDWSFANLDGGRADNLRIVADIPPGIVGRIRQGAKMEPGHFAMSADFTGVSLRTFGELPPIDNASGRFLIEGMQVKAVLQSGEVATSAGKASLSSGSFTIADFGVRPNPAVVDLEIAGSARGLAEIAASEPLRVTERVSMAAEDLTGKGKVKVTAAFPVMRGIKYGDVDWKAGITLAGAASAEPVFGRKVAAADLVIDVDPKRAEVSGTAQIDGVSTRLDMVEPIAQGAKRSRVITAVLDAKAQKRMGLTLEPVVNGTVKVRVEQQPDKPEVHKIDLTNATLSLPWVGWSKGKGIAANAVFRLETTNGVTRLNDFYLEGEGFSAAGSLAFDKKGVVSADFANVSLNQGDSIAVRIARKGSAFRIDVDGARYDARGLINSLIHEGGFTEAQGDANVTLRAAIARVSGFGERSIRGVEMTYAAVDGWFDSLSFRGSTPQGASMSIQASTRDGRTSFNIDSTDAGSALAFTEIYGRMSGGKLQARLTRVRNGPFTGPVLATDFTVSGEPKLDRLIGKTPTTLSERDRATQAAVQQELSARLDTRSVRFAEMRATIDKGGGYLRVAEGVLRSAQFGLTFDGLMFDAQNRMDLNGTFLPAISLSRAIGFIPIVGEILGNGRDSGLIGITFRLRGPSRSPNIEVNPISAIAPGIFRKVFEYR